MKMLVIKSSEEQQALSDLVGISYGQTDKIIRRMRFALKDNPVTKMDLGKGAFVAGILIVQGQDLQCEAARGVWRMDQTVIIFMRKTTLKITLLVRCLLDILFIW